jgi:succinoglycan biosynthesis transport protein ExoP
MKLPARYYPNNISSQPTQQFGGADDETLYYYPEQAQEKHLRDYWNIVLKRIRYIVAIFCGTLALGVAFNVFSPILYTATSILQIEPQNPAVTNVGGVAEATREGGPEYYQTQYALLKSRPLAARVITKLGLESNPAFFKDSSNIFDRIYNRIAGSIVRGLDSAGQTVRGESAPQQPQVVRYELGIPPYLVGQYLQFLTVSPVRNTRLVDVSFETSDPKLSQSLANAHATGFIQMILENRFTLTQEARDFLGKKLAELRQAVQRAETELNRFRQEHGVISLEKGENIIVDRLMDINKELTRARAERLQTESLYQMTRNKNTQYLAQVLNNGLIMSLKGTLANLETEKSRLMSIFTAEHPRIQEINQQIGETRRALNAEITTVVHGIESSYSAARAREEALEAEAKRQQQTALGLKQVGVDYAVLNEEVVVNRGLYDAVLKRLNETSVGNDLAAANIQVMQRAELPGSPSSPNTFRNLVVAAVLGLLLAIGSAVFLEYMDNSVNTPQQVWAAVSLPTLGAVPQLKFPAGRHHPPVSANGRSPQVLSSTAPAQSAAKELVVARDELTAIAAESYRIIRAALLFSQAERPPKVILLTSPSPDEGKTVTTLNVGITLAQGGKRVLVIDGDLRKGRCHQLLNIKNHEGVTNILTGQASLAQCIRPTAIPRLYLLPRGVSAPNPAELLISQKMRDVLNELRSEFDFIVIDSPPIVAVSDAAVLSTISDGVVLVFHGQKTTQPSARRAMASLERVGAPILGVVLNGIDIRHPDYLEYRSYYPSYFASVEKESGWSSHEISGEVSRGFFDRMIAKLREFTGPMASYLVHDAIGALGETPERFPKSRLNELAERISREILDESKRSSFLSWIANETQTSELS